MLQNLKLKEPVSMLQAFLAVTNGIGGTCRYLNKGLQYLLLSKHSDIKVELALGRIRNINSNPLPIKINTDNHSLLIVHIAGKKFLLDPGMASGPLALMLIPEGNEQHITHHRDERFLLQACELPDYGYSLEKFINGKWYRQYDFNLDSATPEKLMKSIDLVYNPKYPFWENLICIRQARIGNITLYNEKLILPIKGEMKTFHVNQFGGIRSVLINPKLFGLSREYVDSFEYTRCSFHFKKIYDRCWYSQAVKLSYFNPNHKIMQAIRLSSMDELKQNSQHEFDKHFGLAIV